MYPVSVLDFKFGRYTHRVHPNKSPLKFREKGLYIWDCMEKTVSRVSKTWKTYGISFCHICKHPASVSSHFAVSHFAVSHFAVSNFPGLWLGLGLGIAFHFSNIIDVLGLGLGSGKGLHCRLAKWETAKWHGHQCDLSRLCIYTHEQR